MIVGWYYLVVMLICLIPFRNIAIREFLDEDFDETDARDQLAGWGLAYGMALVWPITILIMTFAYKPE